MTYLILGLVLFHGLHSLRIVAPNWRDAQLAKMGEGTWKGGYSVVSIIAFVLLIWGYSQARPEAGILYVPPDWGRPVAWFLMLPAFVLMTFNMRSSRFSWLTKHPFLSAIILWSLAHLLANGDSASVLLFGTFLLWAIFAYRSAVARGGELPPVASLPVDLAAIAAGVVLWGVFFGFAHEWLFGVSPV